MKGELAEGVVPDLLRELYVGRRTGTLSLDKGDERQSLRVHRGHIVNAHTTVREERLGETLVRRGLLTEDDFARATEVALQSDKRLGQAFLELGILDKSGLEDALALHIHTLLAKVFTWNEGTFSFEEEEESPGELTLKLSTADLILEAVRAIGDPDVVRYLLGDMDRVLALSNDPLLRFQQLRLSPNDGFVLSRVDGTLCAREIEGMIPLPSEEVQRSLLGLLSTGIVEYLADARRPHEGKAASAPSPPSPPLSEDERPPEPKPATAPQPKPAPAPEPKPAPTPEPQPAPPPADPAATERRREIEEAWDGRASKTHFEVLGLERSATAADVKEAYFRLAKRFHPDVHHGENLGDLRDKLEGVFIRLGEAYDVLRDVEKRGEYEAWIGRPKPQSTPSKGATADASPADAPPAEAADPEVLAQRAEAVVAEAAALFEKEKYWDAIQKIEPILESLTDATRLRAQLVLARCYLQNPKWVKTAKETLEAAVRENPKAAAAYSLLADLYRKQGLRTRAASTYRRVLELRPGDTDAAEALAELGPKEEAPPADEGGGFLKKIFRR